MPAGCDFICKNTECKHYNSGFTVTAPWPMGKIELIIAKLNPTFKAHVDLREQLIKFRDDGRKLACIVFPNIDNIPTEAYRVQLWSQEANCIWAYEIPYNDGEDIENLISTSGIIPEKCPKTNGKLLSFAQLIESSPKCPHCQKELLQSRWFSKNI